MRGLAFGVQSVLRRLSIGWARGTYKETPSMRAYFIRGKLIGIQQLFHSMWGCCTARKQLDTKITGRVSSSHCHLLSVLSEALYNNLSTTVERLRTVGVKSVLHKDSSHIHPTVPLCQGGLVNALKCGIAQNITSVLLGKPRKIRHAR